MRINEFEVKAENKKEAEEMVRKVLNKSTLLNCKIINLVPTEIKINAKRDRTKDDNEETHFVKFKI